MRKVVLVGVALVVLLFPVVAMALPYPDVCDGCYQRNAAIWCWLAGCW